MRFEKQGTIYAATLLWSIAFHNSSYGAGKKDSILIATPNQCVALNRGQKCYQQVTLVWETIMIGDYCIYSKPHTNALRSWHGQNEGEMDLTVETAENIEFSLQKLTPAITLASTTMRVAWVYRQKRQQIASWRLF